MWQNNVWEGETHPPPFLRRFIFLDAVHIFLEVATNVTHMGYKEVVGGKIMDGIVCVPC